VGALNLVLLFCIAVVFSLVSCKDMTENHEEAVRNAIAENKISQYINDHFEAEAMIVHYNLKSHNLSKTWVQVFNIDGYEINYTSKVVLDKDGGSVLQFNEIGNLLVKEIISKDGQTITYGKNIRYYNDEILSELKKMKKKTTKNK
jgi:hypothetical protein